MNDLLQKLVGVLRLRSGPQDLPDSWKFTMSIVGLYLAMNIAMSQQVGDENATATSFAITVLQFVTVWALLLARKHAERLPQTLAALAGTGIMLGIISFIFLVQADAGTQQPMLALGWFSVFIWSLVVDAHIYRHALSITMSQGMLVAVLLLAASYVLVEFAF